MADYTSVTLEYNKAETDWDNTPDWTGTALAQNGSSGASELRFALAADITENTVSGSWHKFRRLTSVGPVTGLAAYRTDGSGDRIYAYDGSRTYARVLRFSFDNTGTPVSKMKLSAYATSSLGAASPGTQPADPASDGSGVVNGHAADTSSTSYLKANIYGSGLTAGGTQETPAAGNVGTTLAATSGTAGAAEPSAGAWLATYQSLQADTQYCQGPAIPQATTAFKWYWSPVLYSGPNLCLGANIAPIYAVQFDRT